MLMIWTVYLQGRAAAQRQADRAPEPEPADGSPGAGHHGGREGIGAEQNAGGEGG